MNLKRRFNTTPFKVIRNGNSFEHGFPMAKYPVQMKLSPLTFDMSFLPHIFLKGVFVKVLLKYISKSMFAIRIP